MGVKNMMKLANARRLCPHIVLVPQKPDLYRRTHNTLLVEIESVTSIDAVKSVGELTCRLDAAQITDPRRLAARLKPTLSAYVGPYLTCSIGLAPYRRDNPPGLKT